MSSSSAVKAGQAYIEIIARDNQLVKGLNVASAKLKAFGSSVASIGGQILGVGAGLAAPIAAAVGAFVTAGDAIDDISQKTGIGAESLSKLQYAADLSGSSLEGVTKAIVKMEKGIGEALSGNAAAAQSFTDIGVSVKALQGLKPEEQFLTVVDALSKIPDEAKRTAAGMAIFGKGASELGEIIRKGGPNLEQLYKDCERLGLVMSGEDAAAAAEFKDSLYQLTRQFALLDGAIFVGELKQLTKYITDVVGRTAAWIKENRQLIILAAKVVAVVLAVGAGLVVVGTLFSSIGAIIGGAVAAFGAIGTVISTVIGLIGFLVSPIGLVIAGLTALTVWFLTSTNAGKQLVSDLIGAFQTFAGEVQTSFGAIVAALKAGDISAAWNVVTTLMSLEWTKFVALLKTQWAGWKAYFLGIWNTVSSTFQTMWESAVDNAAHVVTNLWSALRVGWTESIAFLKQGWVGFVQVIRTIWNKVSSWIGETLASALEAVGLVEEGTTAAVSQMGKDKQKEIDDTAAKSSNDVEVQRARSRVDIAEENQGIHAGLNDEHNRRQKAIDDAQATEDARIKAANQAVVDEQKKAVDEAKSAWESAVETAKNAGKELINPIKDETPTGDLSSKLSAGAQSAIEGTGGSGGAARGTFNVHALQSLFAGDDVGVRQLDEQKKANKLLATIANSGGLVVSS